MTTIDKLIKIDEACDGSIILSHYGDMGWQIMSFKKGTPLHPTKYKHTHPLPKILDEAVEYEYDFIFKK